MHRRVGEYASIDADTVIRCSDRVYGILATAVGPDIEKALFVGGSRIADLHGDEMVVMYLAEGDHIVSAVSDNFFCFEATAETSLTAKVGVTEYVRVGYTLGGTFFVSPATD